MSACGEQAPMVLPAVSRYAGAHGEWDAFVRRTPGGSLFHLIGWKEVLEDTFGLTAHYLVARRGADIAGVLPLFELHAPLMERCLLSLPFAVDGGVCSDDRAAQEALDAAAVALGRARHARYVELRDGREAPEFRLREGRYVRFRRALHDDEAAELAALPSKRRYMLRVAARHGLTTDVGRDATEFHDLYAQTARRFGTPVFPAAFFRALLERFPDATSILTVRRAGVAAAAALLFRFGDTACPYYVGSRREFFRYAVNDFMYWELMRYARRSGARVFDFGRSRIGTGAYRYKQLWGFPAEPVRYRFYALDGSIGPGRTSGDGSLRVAQNLWRRLPLPLTKLLGPFFVSRYGPYYT
jgi:FemAB-related protein (PEP-CTERM system-associated)